MSRGSTSNKLDLGLRGGRGWGVGCAGKTGGGLAGSVMTEPAISVGLCGAGEGVGFTR